MSDKNTGESEKVSGFQLRETSQNSVPEDVPSTPGTPQGGDLDQLGELPHSYGSDTLFLIAQEPRWLFTYWDIDISRHPGGQAHLRVYNIDDALEAEIEVPFETRNWYIPVKRPGSSYSVEIGYYRGQNWKPIARSVPVETPPDQISSAESFDYASIPLHLSFQKLTDTIQTAIRSGESLMHAISRMQKTTDSGFATALTQGAFGPRLILEALLGSELLDELTSGGFGSEEIESRIRAHLEEKLTSAGGASELLSSDILHASGLSSLGFLPVFSGEQASSWDTGAMTSWAAAALTSWTAAAGPGASWSAPSSWTAVAGSSWGGESLGSWTQAVLTSWSAPALSSWLEAVQTNWFQAAQTSWAAAALSSWNQGALSSWTEAATTSWSGGSENVGSFGQASRQFFMHVNAEVIFYGGTDPRAKVTIDGKPIVLNPDGTFRYHFIFPDGKYEIPIVATSPDGVETRSAILAFERGTQKIGGVDDTAQPPLGAPLGAKL